jgi:hypothetical protein
MHIEHTFWLLPIFVAFFSATIDGRNLIFGHKLYIGTPYRGNGFLTRQIPTSCLPKSEGIIIEQPKCMFNVHKNQQGRQTGSMNMMGLKTLPTIWGTYMKLVTKYQISAINSC